MAKINVAIRYETDDGKSFDTLEKATEYGENLLIKAELIEVIHTALRNVTDGFGYAYEALLEDGVALDTIADILVMTDLASHLVPILKKHKLI
ncbi:MAG: hypothetical protein JWP44_4140 [Mucilaginibacter sp.]|nr:hypothetical protein [Mucilaginibacter sp.]